MSADADSSAARNDGLGRSSAPERRNTGAERFRFGVPARLEYRDAVRSFLTHICDRLAERGVLSPKDGHGVVSAFVEAFNNAVIHAYEGHAAGPIEVAMSVDPRALQVEVRDAGRTFVPEDVPEPDLDSLPEGGLGLFIIRNFMDDVRYERRGLQNVLMMRKRLEPRPEGLGPHEGASSAGAPHRGNSAPVPPAAPTDPAAPTGQALKSQAHTSQAYTSQAPGPPGSPGKPDSTGKGKTGPTEKAGKTGKAKRVDRG